MKSVSQKKDAIDNLSGDPDFMTSCLIRNYYGGTKYTMVVPERNY